MLDTKTLEAMGEEELLAELRARQARRQALRPAAACAGACSRIARAYGGSPSLSIRDVPSRAIFDALRRLQRECYGIDSRRDVMALLGQRTLQAADAVVALFHRRRVRDNHDGTSTLEALSLRVRYGVCLSEPFSEQPTAAFATGFLVAPRLIATAGHCVDPPDVTSIRIVFGFRMIDDTTARLVVDNRDVYTGARVIARCRDRQGPDWALIELDRPVPDRVPLPLRRSGRVERGTPLYVLGHPCGLPLKHADGAAVRDDTPPGFFVANLDTYAGSSGSPVLNDEHVVEGIVSRGAPDFVLVDNCYASLVYPDTGGRGQDCTRVTELARLVPDSAPQERPAGNPFGGRGARRGLPAPGENRQ